MGIIYTNEHDIWRNEYEMELKLYDMELKKCADNNWTGRSNGADNKSVGMMG